MPLAMSDNMVKIVNTSLVKPAAETPHHSIWLSNVDLLAVRRAYAPMVWVYHASSSFSLAKLKEGLSRTLVAFYPYAGTLGLDDKGRVELKCDGEGVDAMEAVCDATLEEFGKFFSSDNMRKQLVPCRTSAQPPCPVSMIQVTRFKCGGVCLGATVHHFVADGTAAMYFICSWAAVTRGVDPLTLKWPHLDRTVLGARSPPRVKYDHRDIVLRSNSLSDLSIKPTRLSTATLMISKEQLAMLKGVKEEGVTTFTAVVLHAWQCICRARGIGTDETTRLFIPSDIRRRLTPPLPPEFLGNAVLLISVESGVGDLLSGDATKVIEQVEASKARLNDSYLRSLIDFLEQEWSSLDGDWELGPNDISAVNLLQLPLSEIDFGWGRPILASQAAPPNKGCLSVMRSPNSDGELQFMLTLEEDHMPAFKKFFLGGAGV